MSTSTESTRRFRAKNPDYEKTRYRRVVDFCARWKLAAGCIDCGFAAHPSALDFDHVIGEKRFQISGSQGRSLKSIIKEIEKCVVRCANCHRIASHRRQQVGIGARLG